MAGFTFKLDGLSKALSEIDKYTADVREEVGLEMIELGNAIETQAKGACPVNYGNLRESIKVLRGEGEGAGANNLTANIAVLANYAAYVEFGTGTDVSVPEFIEGLEDLPEYAMQFKGKGVRKINFPARPFFFPAVQQQAQELIPRLKEILTDAAK